MTPQTALWVVFGIAVVGMLAIDLVVFNRRPHEIKKAEALVWSLVWVAVSLVFCAGIARTISTEKALEFLAAYVLEKSLSVDNLFVFVLIFSYFRVPAEQQHRVLAWGIIGALVMRGTMIGAGTVLIQRFVWVLYLFGAFLLYTGVEMWRRKETDSIEPEKNPLLRVVRKLVRLTPDFEGKAFFVRRGGLLFATPLFLVVVVIETTDLAFAVDSIPAVFGVTTDIFIVYTSNIFAILGLRALYFLLAGVIGMFRFLKHGIAAVLILIGVKMIVRAWVHVPISWSLGAIGGILAVSVLASVLFPERASPLRDAPAPGPPPSPSEGGDPGEPSGR